MTFFQIFLCIFFTQAENTAIEQAAIDEIADNTVNNKTDAARNTAGDKQIVNAGAAGKKRRRDARR